MIEATMSFMPDVFASFTREKVVMDSRTRAAYSQAYAFGCSDGKIVGLQLSSLDKFWVGLVQALEAPKLLRDERFLTRMLRIKNSEVLTGILSAAFRHRPRIEWMKRLERADVPHAPVHRIDEVLQDSEVIHNESFYDVEHPSMGTVRFLHRPVLYNGRRRPGRYPPPVLGEHTDQILRAAKTSMDKAGSKKKRHSVKTKRR